MFTKGKLMFLYAESPVHPGAGEGVGAIDLPIQREKITSWPIIQASGIKGTLREHFEIKGAANNELFVVFGPDPDRGGNPSDNSGAISFTDANVLLFPVRSLNGTFAYVTCPLAITRLRRDLETLEDATGHNLIDDNFEKAMNLEGRVIPDGKIGVSENSPSELVISHNSTKEIVLEEYAFKVMDLGDPRDALDGLVEWLKAKWPEALVGPEKRTVLVSDNTFKDFVEGSTEVITRIRIDDDTGTVQKGALWTEEYLPRETFMYSLVLACYPFKRGVSGLSNDDDILAYVCDNSNSHTPDRIWLGGNQTIGKGALRIKFV